MLDFVDGKPLMLVPLRLLGAREPQDGMVKMWRLSEGVEKAVVEAGLRARSKISI